MNNCLNCGTHTTNPKFCSRSCAATYTNKQKPKRSRTRKCSNCEDIVAHHKTTLCEQHLKEYKSSSHYKNLTIGEYRNKSSIDGRHPSWRHAHIRSFARSWLKDLIKQECESCGYDKHTELAHIKAIADFDDSALLGEVNNINNIIVLCPNCHWEFDNLPRDNFPKLSKYPLSNPRCHSLP
jgi:hypothetical protein